MNNIAHRPAEDRRLSWPEWLVTNRGGLPARRGSPNATSRVRRRVTSLSETNALPLSQAASQVTTCSAWKTRELVVEIWTRV